MKCLESISLNLEKYLEGKRLTVELVEEVVKHSIGRVRNILRHAHNTFTTSVN